MLRILLVIVALILPITVSADTVISLTWESSGTSESAAGLGGFDTLHIDVLPGLEFGAGINQASLSLAFDASLGTGFNAVTCPTTGTNFLPGFCGGLADFLPGLQPLGAPIVDNGSGIAGSFTAFSLSASLSNEFRLGSIDFDRSVMPAGQFVVSSFLQPGLDGFFDAFGNQLDPILTSATWGDPSAVPIPAAAWLFGSALLGLGLVKRKQA